MSLFAALGDPTRQEIVELLAQTELSAGDIASRFACSAPAISHHLKVLREAGLVRHRVDAQRRIYALEASGLDTLEGWVAHQRRFWNRQLDRLEAQIAREIAEEALSSGDNHG